MGGGGGGSHLGRERVTVLLCDRYALCVSVMGLSFFIVSHTTIIASIGCNAVLGEVVTITMY